MQAQQFIRKWQAGSPAHALNERAGAQAHFIDLCRVLGVPEPGDPDSYCFERGVTKTGSAVQRTDGFADVWLRGHFGWEYKAPGKSLEGALKQLMMYALPLENPPLLVVSDRLRIEVHTHFTGTPSEKHVFALEDLTRPDVQQRLRTLWTAPDAWRPARSNATLPVCGAEWITVVPHRPLGVGSTITVPAQTVVVLHGQVLNHPQSVAASPLSPVATHLLAAEDSEAGEVPAEVETGASADEAAAEQPPAGQASPDAASAAEAPADPS